jgi:hypothetical protein
MCRFNSKPVLALCLLLLSCGGEGKKTEGNAPKPAFKKTLLLGDFSGEQVPACGTLRIEKEKKALALLELGMNGLSLEDYRTCYKKEFLK